MVRSVGVWGANSTLWVTLKRRYKYFMYAPDVWFHTENLCSWLSGITQL